MLLSGGVDSSLSLRLLKAAGHHCKAFYLQIWFQEDFRNFWDACPWEADLEFARKVRGQTALLGVHKDVRMVNPSTALPNAYVCPCTIG